jgi:hypothetical protein
MNYFQLYETHKEQYKLLKPGSIWGFKGMPSIKIKIISRNGDNGEVQISNIEPSAIESVSIPSSYVLHYYEPYNNTI